jgi:hypothetical protein
LGEGHDGERGGQVDAWGARQEVLADELGEELVGDGRAVRWEDFDVAAQDEDVAF